MHKVRAYRARAPSPLLTPSIYRCAGSWSFSIVSCYSCVTCLLPFIIPTAPNNHDTASCLPLSWPLRSLRVPRQARYASSPDHRASPVLSQFFHRNRSLILDSLASRCRCRYHLPRPLTPNTRHQYSTSPHPPPNKIHAKHPDTQTSRP